MELPERALLIILKRLSPQQVNKCAQVCWHWNVVANDDQLWKRFYVSHFRRKTTRLKVSAGNWKRLYSVQTRRASLFARADRISLFQERIERLQGTHAKDKAIAEKVLLRLQRQNASILAEIRAMSCITDSVVVRSDKIAHVESILKQESKWIKNIENNATRVISAARTWESSLDSTEKAIDAWQPFAAAEPGSGTHTPIEFDSEYVNMTNEAITKCVGLLRTHLGELDGSALKEMNAPSTLDGLADEAAAKAPKPLQRANIHHYLNLGPLSASFVEKSDPDEIDGQLAQRETAALALWEELQATERDTLESKKAVKEMEKKSEELVKQVEINREKLTACNMTASESREAVSTDIKRLSAMIDELADCGVVDRLNEIVGVIATASNREGVVLRGCSRDPANWTFAMTENLQMSDMIAQQEATREAYRCILGLHAHAQLCDAELNALLSCCRQHAEIVEWIVGGAST